MLIGVGPGADGSTRAAAVAGTMLGVLAAVMSLVWALYTFKPGLVRVDVGKATAAGPLTVVDQTSGSQQTPLLMSTTVQNGQTSSDDVTTKNVQTTNVDLATSVNLASYFSPMTTTTTTMDRGIQADLDSGVTAAGWTVSSALATQSKSGVEATKSRGGAELSDGGGGISVGVQADTTDQGAPAVHSTYLYESRTATDTTRATSQVRQFSLCLLLRYRMNRFVDVVITTRPLTTEGRRFCRPSLN